MKRPLLDSGAAFCVMVLRVLLLHHFNVAQLIIKREAQDVEAFGKLAQATERELCCARRHLECLLRTVRPTPSVMTAVVRLASAA